MELIKIFSVYFGFSDGDLILGAVLNIGQMLKNECRCRLEDIWHGSRKLAVFLCFLSLSAASAKRGTEVELKRFFNVC